MLPRAAVALLPAALLACACASAGPSRARDARARAADELWTQGGLMYAPPVR